MRNSGRYSSEENVRADIAATMVTAMDMTARSTLYDMNQAIMESIDALLIDRRYAKKIPIFDTFSRTDSPNTSQYQNTSVYQNYYFGQKSTSIVSPEQCSIARGSDNLITEFGRSQLVEGNIMYDTSATE